CSDPGAALGRGKDPPGPGGHRLGRRTPADVQEVRRLPTGLRDHVEGGHDQPGAVADDADLTVQLDVVETALLGRLFLRVDREGVAQLLQVGVTEQRRVVDGDLAVERLDLPVGGEYQRVDLDQHAVVGQQHLGQLGGDLAGARGRPGGR